MFSMQYFEVSALKNTNIKQLFDDAVSKMYIVITSKENEELDDKTLDQIGIKKFIDKSALGLSMDTMGIVDKEEKKSIKKEASENY